MILTNEELKKIYFGAYEFEETPDGFLKANQYTKAQMDYFKGAFEMWYERCDASTAKTLELRTDASKISFDYKFLWKCSEDSVELYVDGLASQIFYVKDMKEEGRLEFTLPEGVHDVVIYLVADATLVIKEFSIDSSYEIPVKDTKVLWLGDSITQGYGPLRSSETYVSIANRELNWDIINQDIRMYKELGGGAVYDLGCYCTTMILSLIDSKTDLVVAKAEFNDKGADVLASVILKFRLSISRFRIIFTRNGLSRLLKQASMFYARSLLL